MDTNNYGNIGKRICAYIIDGFLIGIAYSVLWVTLYYYAIASWAIVWIAYFAGFESSEWMATPGKRAMGLIVTDMNGNRIGVGTAIIRNLGKMLSLGLGFIGLIIVCVTARKQGLHDLISDTLVLEAGGYYNTYSNGTGNRSYGYPVLYGVSGVYAGKSIPIGNYGLVIGRDPSSCNLVMPSDIQGISRVHCTIVYNAGFFVLSDAGSSYGTFLDSGLRVVQGKPVNLRPNERFYIASRGTMFEVRM